MRRFRRNIDENMPHIVNVQSRGRDILDVTVSVPAVNNIVARQRARTFIRRKYPTAKNILSPDIDSSETKQTTFNELFPESLHREDFRVDVVVVQ